MSTSSYTDLEIRILKREATGYPVEITFNGDQEFPRGHLTPDLPSATLDDPRQTGEALFAWLFHEPNLAAAWAEARGQRSQRRIRLRIDDTAPELHALPWETLRDPKSDYLAALDSTPFSRYLAAPSIPGSPILRRPIRILVAIASPHDLEDFGYSPIDADNEWNLLQQTLAQVPNLELIRLPAPCTLSAIEQAVKSGVHILHFIGHGEFANGQTTLVLANTQNEQTPTPGENVAAMLGRQLISADAKSDDKLRLVYLSSCQTATRDAANAFHGLAPMLVHAGVPAVVAMQATVLIKTAQPFSQTFYRELMSHGEVDRAANAARSALLTAELPGAAIPVLFLRLRSAQLFGHRGTILGDVSDSYWRTLAGKIRRGQCTPILGPGVASGLLPAPEDLARELAADTYPFADPADLRRVSQFLGSMDDGEMRQRVLDKLTASINRHIGATRIANLADLTLTHWQNITQPLETEIHRQLASLGLPLYVTTNCDNFMTLALQARPGNPAVRRESVIWRQPLEERVILSPSPSAENPVVLHLFGTAEDPESMVLTEDDHLDYLARISHDQEIFLPASVNALLARNTLLFLGYRLEDLDLKVILRGLLTYLALTKYDRMQLAVQIETERHDAAAQREVTDYFQRSFRQYFSPKSDVKIYWGSSHQFMSDLMVHMEDSANG